MLLIFHTSLLARVPRRDTSGRLRVSFLTPPVQHSCMPAGPTTLVPGDEGGSAPDAASGLASGHRAQRACGVDGPRLVYPALRTVGLAQALRLHLVEDVPHGECVRVERLADRRERACGQIGRLRRGQQSPWAASIRSSRSSASICLTAIP